MPKNTTPHVDDWIISEDIKAMPATFRSVQAPTDWVRIALRGLPTATTFSGPNLFATVETARLAHRDQYGSRTPPIYDLVGGIYNWWDGTTSTDPQPIRDKARSYLSELFGIPSRNVQISYSHSS